MMKMNRLEDKHRQLVRMILDNRYRLIAASVFSLLIAGTNSAIPFLLKPVVDDIFINKDVTLLVMLPVAVLLVFFLKGIGMYGSEFMMNYVGENVIRRLRDRLYDHIQDMPLAFFHKERTGVLMSRITNDVNIVKALMSTAVTSTMKDFFSIIGLTCATFYMDWKMALLAFVVLPVAFYPVVEFGRRVRRASTGCQEAMAEMNAFLHETLSGNKIVKAFLRESYEKKRFFSKTKHLFRLEMKAVIARSLSSPIMEFLAGVGISLVLWYGGSRVIAGTLTAGEFSAFLAAVMLLYDPVKKLSHLNNSIQQGFAAVDRIYNILEIRSDVAECDHPVRIKAGPHRVAFRHVAFKYEKERVLEDINLEVNSGEILALVGMSGGGKTSLVNLIPRFYDVTDGCIELDGMDIRSATIKSLRRQIAIVTQEPILFNDTVRANIAYGKQNATEAEIETAAKAAYALDFVNSFPQGFDTMIGELGARLSGGEKQRLCIARALLKDAPILILDEATSSLDTEAEQLVQQALDNLMKGRTTFVIAHRLSTIAYADRIIVLSGGKIIEEGKHHDLLTRRGEYFKLHNLQFSNGGV